MKGLWAMLFLASIAGWAFAEGSETLSVTPTPDGKSTQLSSAAGTNLVIPLLEVKTLAVLKSPSGVGSILLAGRSCIECDENRSLYLVPEAFREGKLLRYDYPGTLRANDTGKPVQRVRAFYGDCVGSGKDALVLLITNAAIEKRVKAGACHEVPGLDQRSEP